MTSAAESPDDSIHPQTLAEWRAWLEAHHATSQGIWLITWRTSSGKVGLPYEECVMEALCFGWVDSVARRIDVDRGMQRYTPRRKKSNWTRYNKERVARLIEEGRMTPAGLAEVERAQADGRWTLFDSVEALELPADLAGALDALPPARANYEAFPATAKKGILGWLVTAKTEATRAHRVRTAAEMAQRNERANEPTWKPKPKTEAE